MKEEEYLDIIEKQKNLQELPNSDLVKIMDLLSEEFESTKQKIINSTYYLDNIELMYNNTLKEFQNRK
jgi:predicted RND superfamily exporter protein